MNFGAGRCGRTSIELLQLRAGRRHPVARTFVHHAELLRVLQQRVRLCNEATDTYGFRVEDQQGENSADHSKCRGDLHRGGEARLLFSSVQRLDLQADETGLGRGDGASTVASDSTIDQRGEATHSGHAGRRRLRGEPRGG